MTWLQAVVLGVVQGLTEYLPISSSAHLVLVPWLLGWRIDEHIAFPFDVLVQWGTLIPVLAHFRRELLEILRGWWEGARNGSPFGTPGGRLGGWVIVATLPAVVAGLLFKKPVEAVFLQPTLTAALLSGTAVLLWWGERFGRRGARSGGVDPGGCPGRRPGPGPGPVAGHLALGGHHRRRPRPGPATIRGRPVQLPAQRPRPPGGGPGGLEGPLRDRLAPSGPGADPDGRPRRGPLRLPGHLGVDAAGAPALPHALRPILPFWSAFPCCSSRRSDPDRARPESRAFRSGPFDNLGSSRLG